MKLFYDKYIKLAHIGKGANAHVYKVRHAELGYVRAIKILNDYIESKDEKLYQSFLKECKTLLAIGNGAHPNIVRIYGPDLIDNHAVVEMDYVQGTTLDSYITHNGFIDYEVVKTFILDIVGALAYSHHDIYRFLMNPEEDDLQIDPNDGRKYVITPEKETELVNKYGISHNDLHSNNVMRRDYDGHFVLLDFGLAVQDGKCVKSSRMGDGNPEYQAPEKFDSETVDPRSDVYSLGILIYELLAGRVPFQIQYDESGKISHKALNIVLNQHLTATPPPILPFRKAAFEKQIPGGVYERDYPEWLDEVVMKCLAKKPEDRFANAKVLLNTFVSNLNRDITNNGVIIELKDTIAQLDKQYQEEKEINNELIEELNEIKQDNKDLLHKLEVSKKETEQINEFKATISKITNQYLNEKAQKEELISQINHGLADSTTGESRKWKVICGTIAGVLLFGVVGIWLYKDSQVKLIGRNYANTLLFAESMGVSGEEVSQMLDSLDKANIEFGEFPILMPNNKRTIDSLQNVIENLQKPGDSKNSTANIIRLQKEISDLNQQLTTLKNQSTSKTTKIEYKTSQDVQKELERLRSENKKLKGQVERFLQTLSN